MTLINKVNHQPGVEPLSVVLTLEVTKLINTNMQASSNGGLFFMRHLVNTLQQINATLRKIAHRLEEIESNPRKEDQ